MGKRTIRLFRLGKTKSGDICNYKLRNFGATVILANPQGGKSSVGKELVLKLYEAKINRPIIVLDCYGEWTKSVTVKSDYIASTYGDWEPFAADKEDVLILDNIAFKISDMKYYTDWAHIRFEPKAAWFMKTFAKSKSIHKDDPEKFAEILRDLQLNVNTFNLKYPEINLPEKIHFSTAKAMDTAFMHVRDWFYNPHNNQQEHQYVDDWFEAIKNHKITIINFNLRSREEIEKAGLWVGKILEILAFRLKELRPIIISEESSFLFSSKKDEFYKSTDQFFLYITKYMGYNVNLIFITQSAKIMLPTAIHYPFDQYIIGQVGKDEPFYEESNKYLKTSFQRNIRQFLYHDRLEKTSSRYFTIFTPDRARCRVEK